MLAGLAGLADLAGLARGGDGSVLEDGIGIATPLRMSHIPSLSRRTRQSQSIHPSAHPFIPCFVSPYYRRCAFPPFFVLLFLVFTTLSRPPRNSPLKKLKQAPSGAKLVIELGFTRTFPLNPSRFPFIPSPRMLQAAIAPWFASFPMIACTCLQPIPPP